MIPGDHKGLSCVTLESKVTTIKEQWQKLKLLVRYGTATLNLNQRSAQVKFKQTQHRVFMRQLCPFQLGLQSSWGWVYIQTGCWCDPEKFLASSRGSDALKTPGNLLTVLAYAANENSKGNSTDNLFKLVCNYWEPELLLANHALYVPSCIIPFRTTLMRLTLINGALVNEEMRKVTINNKRLRNELPYLPASGSSSVLWSPHVHFEF